MIPKKDEKVSDENENVKLDENKEKILAFIRDIANEKLLLDGISQSGFDSSKLPLGRISEKQISEGFLILKEIEKALEEKNDDQDEDNIYKNRLVLIPLDLPEDELATEKRKPVKKEATKKKPKESSLAQLSSRFYTIIPHDFGRQLPPTIETTAMLQTKIRLLESLLEVKTAMQFMQEVPEEGMNGLSKEECYLNLLGAKLDVVSPNSEEFSLMQQYTKRLLKNVFKVSRHQEVVYNEKFQKFRGASGVNEQPNCQLLFHGSRKMNFLGILSQGLRIAPPEAPMSGYAFGKGIYFADVFQKSYSYCRGDNYMLVCEVLTGDMYETTGCEYMESAPKGFHSTKYTGDSVESSFITENGVGVPFLNSKSHYSEYIVYETSSVILRYIIHF